MCGDTVHLILCDFNPALQVRPLGDPVTSATIAVYRAVSRELLPTPSKSHYLFNTRDMAKIISGMMQVSLGLMTHERHRHP